ncbi:MAG TPA: RnfABCDGE type electron transport complex subunit B [Candidatus Cloacimonetes bacterium]|nr:RnfABCDGE type electron transport complex subunit B [Candidatus Cloacimonadota bacterium]
MLFTILQTASLFATIGIPVIVIGSLGLIFGLILAVASKVFEVKIDPRVAEIIEILPGANCGACGLAGCAGYADRIVKEGEAINKCAPGGAATVAIIAKIMGMEAKAMEQRVAVIHCSSGGKNNTKWKYSYEGVDSCKAAVNIAGGPNSCAWGCMGLNDCLKACPFDAISLDPNGMRVIDYDKCTACGMCVEACPRNLIHLIPINRNVYIKCSSNDRGADARKVCGSAKPCIACGLCAKECPEQCITIENNIARIDYSLCTNCGLCATVCPSKTIQDLLAGMRKKADINPEACIGCTLCTKVCPTDAIQGELKEVHVVDKAKCIGCARCVEKCPKNAIEMI